ncbi:MAG: hypothetical protein ABI947_15435 [Chloroflexota bacterium]
MISIQEIEQSLLDIDGSCRDINFEAPTWKGTVDLLRWFCKNYVIFSADTAEGTDLKTYFAECENFELSIPLPEEYIHLSGANSQALIAGLQVYVGNEEDGTPFVELTFFPETLNATFSGMAFVHLVEELRQMLQSSRYYVRRENASWKFGSSGIGSGVIFQSGDVIESEDSL